MAVRKITVSLPEELVREFTRRAPAQQRSRYIARAVSRSICAEDDALTRACEAASADPDDIAIREEFDTMNDPLAEAWESTAAR